MITNTMRAGERAVSAIAIAVVVVVIVAVAGIQDRTSYQQRYSDYLLPLSAVQHSNNLLL